MVGVHACGVDEVAGLDEHAAAAAGGVQQHAGFRLQHVDDHLHQRLGREEYAVVLGDVLGEFVEEVLVNPTDYVTTHVVQGVVVEDAQQLPQQLIGEHGVVLGQHAHKLFALLLHQLHGVVDHLAQTVHGLLVAVQQLHAGQIRGQVHQVLILCLFWQEKGALCGEVGCLNGDDTAPAHGAVLQQLGLHPLEAAVSVA